MRYIVILITIIIYWFLLFIGMTFLVQDELLFSTITEGGIGEISVNDSEWALTELNFTGDSTGSKDSSISRFIAGTAFLFGMRSQISFEVPSIIRFIIGFINWILLMLTIVTLYKLVNPLSSG